MTTYQLESLKALSLQEQKVKPYTKKEEEIFNVWEPCSMKTYGKHI